MADPRSVAYCRPCKVNMEHSIEESMGDQYSCPSCGASVEISYSGPPAITVDIDQRRLNDH